MEKVLKYVGITITALFALALLLAASVGIYPEISKVRKACNQLEMGMARAQVESILHEVRTESPDMQAADKWHIFVMKNGVDCSVKFDSEGLVESISTAQDGF